MSSESILGITGATVAASIERSGIFRGGDITSFTESVQKAMVEEQPELYAFLATVGGNPTATPNRGAFIVGMTNSYDMIDASERARPLTRDQMMSVVGTLREHSVTEIHDGVEVEVHNPNSWIADIANDSPVFGLWLQKAAQRFRTHEEQISFIQAGFYTTIPFIRRAQAEELERQFFPEE